MNLTLKKADSGKQQFISYQYTFKLEFWLILLWTVLLGGTMLYYAQEYNALSPFISNPQDMISPFSAWAQQANCADSLDGKQHFFLLDIFFSIGLSLLLASLFFGFFNKEKECKEGPQFDVTTNHFIFSWPSFGKQLKKQEASIVDKWLKWVFVIILLLAFIGDEIENFSFLFDADLGESSTIKQLLNVQSAKMALFGLAGLLIVYRICHGFFKDHYPVDSDFSAFIFDKIKYILRYFYPSLIGMVVLAYILNTFNAFDSLIIEVLDLPNFLLFIVLFAGTLFTVWFIPYYLRFSKTFYEDLASKKEVVVKDLIIEFLLKKQKATEDNTKKLVNEEYSKTKGIRETANPEKVSKAKAKIAERIHQEQKIEIVEFIKQEMDSNNTLNAYFLNAKIKNLYSPIGLQEISQEEEEHTLKDIKELPQLKSRGRANNGKPKENTQSNSETTEWNYLQKRLINGVFKQASYTPDDYFFHNLRRFIAYIFIMILLSMEGQLLDNVLNTSYWQPLMIGLSMLGMVFYMEGYRQSIIKTKEGNLFISSTHLTIAIGTIGLHFLATIWLLFCIIKGHEWFELVVGFIINTNILPFSFMSFSLYRRVGKKYKFVKKTTSPITEEPLEKGLSTSTDEKESLSPPPGYVFMPKLNNAFKGLSYKSLELFMPVFLIGTILFLAVCFVWIIGDINNVIYVNPLNLFLIFFNGVLTLFAVLDRYFTLIKKTNKFKSDSDFSKEDAEKSRNWRFQIVTIFSLFILLLLATSTRENHYHDVDYYPLAKKSKAKEKAIFSLSGYTAEFLGNEKKDTSKKAPIILVASDGGGLRAAYWTLLVMNELDALTNEQFSKRVFMTTGISGGGIGLSMYTFQKAKDMNLPNRKRMADKIGRTNFLSGDMAGIFGRGFVTLLIPTFFDLSCWEDRSEAMAKNYFNLHNEYLTIEKKITYTDFKKQPFHTLWTEKGYDLPLLVVNTARTEDGARGIVHPLPYNADSIKVFVDLNKNYKEEYISYPDATFLTNRFPIMSPSGRIEGKGHFVDGGYLENSGLSTLSYYLQKMSAKVVTPKDSIFQEFRDRKIIVISINNDKSTYIQSLFGSKVDSVNQSSPKGELSSIIGASASTGTTALPAYYKKIFADPNFGKRYGISDFEFIPIQLPYRFNAQDVHQAFYGQIADCTITDSVNTHNNRLLKFWTGNPNHASSNFVPINMPPLGRMLPENTRDYMKKMLTFPEVKNQLDSIKMFLEKN